MISILEIDRKRFEKVKKDILEIEKRSFITPWNLIHFLDELMNPSSHIWGIFQDEKIIGYICFWLVADEIHILNLAIHPDMRRKGMAKLLLDKLIDWAINKDIASIWLEVRPSNKPAISLYEKFGFKKVGIRKGYYTDTKEDAILMELKLREVRHASKSRNKWVWKDWKDGPEGRNR